jgi:hypothetical protein
MKNAAWEYKTLRQPKYRGTKHNNSLTLYIICTTILKVSYGVCNIYNIYKILMFMEDGYHDYVTVHVVLALRRFALRSFMPSALYLADTWNILSEIPPEQKRLHTYGNGNKRKQSRAVSSPYTLLLCDLVKILLLFNNFKSLYFYVFSVTASEK